MLQLPAGWPPLFSYAWWTDIGTPGLSGVGGILVGIGAIVVAARSHTLAARVREDEQEREEAATRERYRDQLFRTVEPTITAMLEHRAELQASAHLGGQRSRVLFAAALTRLRLVAAVTTEPDRTVVRAVLRAYNTARKTERAHVVGLVLGDLMLTLAALLEEDRDCDDLIRAADNVTDKMVSVLDKRDAAKSSDD